MTINDVTSGRGIAADPLLTQVGVLTREDERRKVADRLRRWAALRTPALRADEHRLLREVLAVVDRG